MCSAAAMISGPMPSPCATVMGTRLDAIATELLDQSDVATHCEISREYTGNVGGSRKYLPFQAIETARLSRVDQTADYVAHPDEHGGGLLLRARRAMVVVGPLAYDYRD